MGAVLGKRKKAPASSTQQPSPSERNETAGSPSAEVVGQGTAPADSGKSLEQLPSKQSEDAENLSPNPDAGEDSSLKIERQPSSGTNQGKDDADDAGETAESDSLNASELVDLDRTNSSIRSPLQRNESGPEDGSPIQKSNSILQEDSFRELMSSPPQRPVDRSISGSDGGQLDTWKLPSPVLSEEELQQRIEDARKRRAALNSSSSSTRTSPPKPRTPQREATDEDVLAPLGLSKRGKSKHSMSFVGLPRRQTSSRSMSSAASNVPRIVLSPLPRF